MRVEQPNLTRLHNPNQLLTKREFKPYPPTYKRELVDKLSHTN